MSREGARVLDCSRALLIGLALIAPALHAAAQRLERPSSRDCLAPLQGAWTFDADAGASPRGSRLLQMVLAFSASLPMTLHVRGDGQVAGATASEVSASATGDRLEIRGAGPRMERVSVPEAPERNQPEALFLLTPAENDQPVPWALALTRLERRAGRLFLVAEVVPRVASDHIPWEVFYALDPEQAIEPVPTRDTGRGMWP